MTSRLLPAVLLGVAVSLGLFWLMQFMITQNQAPREKKSAIKRVEFVRLKREPPPPPKKKRLKKPEKVEVVKEPPKKPPARKKPSKKSKIRKKSTKKRVVKAPVPTTKASGSGAPIRAQKSLTQERGLTAARPVEGEVKKARPQPTAPARVKASRGLVPLYRVPPKYPRRAAQRGVEGWVKVQFVITVAGRVKNAKVVSSKPAGIFDRAALKAITKWKFKPKVIKGQRVEQLAVQVLQFKLKRRRR